MSIVLHPHHYLLCFNFEKLHLKGIKSNSQPVRNKKNRENTRQTNKITRIRQYSRGSAICLRPRSCRNITIIREEYRVQLAATIFSLLYKNTVDPHFSRAPLLNRRDSLFICEKLIFRKVGVATYFIFIFEGKIKQEIKP